MKTHPKHQEIEVPVTTLTELRQQFEETRGWLFRGHQCANWLLEPTAVRCARRNGLQSKDTIQTFEQRCYKEFTRRAHLWFPFRPATDSATEWLAWMQHYSAPTRLLDVSLSPWVAAFFAAEDLTPPDQGASENFAAVWAIHRELLRAADPDDAPNRDRNKLLGFRVDPKGFKSRGHEDSYAEHCDGSRVEETLPHLVPDRIPKQKGMFIFGFDLTKPACESLVASAQQKSPDKPKNYLRKLLIPSSLRRELLSELALMNIDAETLFPSPDGFGRSLRCLM
jgi:hypothetical protein